MLKCYVTICYPTTSNTVEYNENFTIMFDCLVGVYTIFWKLSYIDSKAKAKATSLPDGFTENPI